MVLGDNFQSKSSGVPSLPELSPQALVPSIAEPWRDDLVPSILGPPTSTDNLTSSASEPACYNLEPACYDLEPVRYDLEPEHYDLPTSYDKLVPGGSHSNLIPSISEPFLSSVPEPYNFDSIPSVSEPSSYDSVPSILGQGGSYYDSVGYNNLIRPIPHQNLVSSVMEPLQDDLVPSIPGYRHDHLASYIPGHSHNLVPVVPGPSHHASVPSEFVQGPSQQASTVCFEQYEYGLLYGSMLPQTQVCKRENPIYHW